MKRMNDYSHFYVLDYHLVLLLLAQNGDPWKQTVVDIS